MPKAAGYPEGINTATTTCPDCDAPASITFQPRTLRVTFACSLDAAHGFRRSSVDGELIPRWIRGGRECIASSLVAPVLAGLDDAWQRLYGTRADAYVTTVSAPAHFDAARNPCDWFRISGAASSASGCIHPGHGPRQREAFPAQYEYGVRHADNLQKLKAQGLWRVGVIPVWRRSALIGSGRRWICRNSPPAVEITSPRRGLAAYSFDEFDRLIDAPDDEKLSFSRGQGDP